MYALVLMQDKNISIYIKIWVYKLQNLKCHEIFSMTLAHKPHRKSCLKNFSTECENLNLGQNLTINYFKVRQL